MPAVAFSHYNLRARRALLEELRVFYCEVVGLRVGERPPFATFGYWLYAGSRAVLHLTESPSGAAAPAEVRTSFDHAAFNCTGRIEFERTLSQHGIKFKVARVPKSDQVQLFFRDPAGNGVELTFENADA
jgi:catechol-2,3-dioxygenase